MAIDENYVPYGPEWEAQLMKLKKKELIDWIRKAFIEAEVYKQKLKKFEL